MAGKEQEANLQTKGIALVEPKPPANLPNVKTYSALRARIGEILTLGWQKMQGMKQTIRWEIGRSIYAHVLQNGNRAAYGKEVVIKLARDFEVSDEVLYQAKRFYEANQIPKLTWKLTLTHQLALARVSDSKKRDLLERQAIEQDWTVEELEKKVRVIVKPSAKTASHGKAVSKPELLEPKKGKIGIFQIIENKGRLSIDLGFTSYLELGAKSKNLKAGDFIVAAGNTEIASATLGTLPRNDWRYEKVLGTAAGDLFTYEAELERVVDGDTVWMKIWLKEPLWLREKLRLRGLDTPELDTAAGPAAKRFVESVFKKAVSVTITTTKPDKWDRYLSDIFLKMEDGKEIFLNNLLLEKSFAVRRDKFSLLDWEK